METLFGTSWKSSVLALFAGVALYFQQVGVAFPTTAGEWGTAIVSALVFAWGRISKDADQTGVATPASVTLTQEQFDQLLRAASQGSQAGLNADELAKAFAKTQKVENAQAPMVSVFNPKGDRDNPKPALRAKTTQNGIELGTDSLTWEEIVALNCLPAGEFRVTKANGDRIPFTIRHVKGFNENTIERVEIHYPCKDEHRTDHKSLLDYICEVLKLAGQSEDVERILALKAEMDALRQKIA